MTGALLPPEVRERFRVPGPGPYLASHSAGAQPRSAIAALHRHFLDPWGQRGGDWDAWLAAIDGWRGALAALLDAEAQDICPTPGVGEGLARYVSALDAATERRTILLAPSAFPTIGFVAGGLAARGWRLRYLPTDADVRLPASWAAALDADVALVIAMHVSSVSGARADMAGIAAAARAAGARCIADCAQSAGVVPVEPAAWGVDAAISSCLKWLCGGPGAGWLWVAPHDRTVLEPATRGWWSHADPFAMDIHDFRYAPDARRWWGGTPDVAPFVLAGAGLGEIAALGVAAIADHNRTLQAMLRDQLKPLTPQWRWPLGAIGGSLCIGLGDDHPRVAAAVAAGGIQADFRGDVLRLSFHAYNGADDVTAVVEALRQ
jgi:selenocysteine lyase/cysteine desulfurase